MLILARLTSLSTILPAVLATLVLLHPAAQAQEASHGAMELTAVEIQRRLEVCRNAEAWLRDACLGALHPPDPTAAEAIVPDAQADATAAATAPDELHLVGIYEPRTVTAGQGSARRGQVDVTVDRPGRTVVLVLGSYEPVRWSVTTRAGTQVARIIIGGHGANRSEATMNGAAFAVERADLPLAYRSDGARFQPFHAAASDLVDMPNADSFQGDYTAPARGFYIARAPGVITRDDAWAAAFEGARDRATLSPRLQAALGGERASTGATWQFNDDGFIGLDNTGTAVRYDAPLTLPEISWPMGAAYDPEAQIVWGISLGGEGFLYEYDIVADRWLAWSMQHLDAGGLIYDDLGNRLIATPGPHLNGGYLIMDRRATVFSSVRIPVEDYPGLLLTFDPGNGPRPALVPLAVDGNEILVRAAPRSMQPDVAVPSLIYLVSLTDGTVELVR